MKRLINTGSIRLNSLISDILPIDQHKKAFELANSERVMKVLIKPCQTHWIANPLAYVC
jgi:threonine dehydrogenase-like Zn-dependent dehydrogenase